MSVGPVAMSSLLVLAGISAMATPGSDKYIALAIATALFVGIIQIAFGVFRLGFLVNFLSNPVIKGFTAAAAVIIATSQLTHLLGVPLPRSNHIDVLISGVFEQWDAVHMQTLLMGIAATAIILVARAISDAIPGALIAVIAGIVAVSVFHLDAAGVAIVGEVPRGLPSFQVPRFSFFEARDLISLVFLLTFVSMIESIAIAKAVQGHSKYRVNPDQELMALGISKIFGAFFQSYPTTGSFSRTAINARSGALTGISSIVAAGIVSLTLLFLTPLFQHLPRVVLAAVIVTAVTGLVDIKTAKRLWKIHRTDFFMLLITFVATLYLGILQGVAAGVILSLILMVYRSTKPHVTMLGRIPGTTHFRNVTRFPEVEESEDTLIVRFDAPLFFGNASYFTEAIEEFMDEKGRSLRYLILDASSIYDIDSSGANALTEIISNVREKRIRFMLAAAIGPLRDWLYRAGLMDLIGAENQFLDVNDAMQAIDGEEANAELALQTNLRDES
jgi:SulP family sulfate permease